MTRAWPDREGSAAPDDAGPGQDAWFSRAEYLARIAKVQAELVARGCDALLAFEPESVTYLTGFFTRGYSTFQFAVIPASGEPGVLCRDVAGYYLDTTCVFDDRAVWADGDDRMAVAAAFLRRKLGDAGRIAVELGAWQLNAERWLALHAALPRYSLEDAARLVARVRLIKSPGEIALQRIAGNAAEAGMAAAHAAAGAGVSEREIAAEVCAALVRAGSDLPGPGIMSSGERARHLHGGYSDRVLRDGDTVQMECTPSSRYYHARFMRTIKIGGATPEEREQARLLLGIQDAALREVAPGMPAALPDRIYREGVLTASLAKSYTNKTFYSIGLMMPPIGGEFLEATPGCEWTFEPGMTFHTYVLAGSFGFSETITIVESGYERLTNFPRELLIA
jgi:Xaa-Pro dipeptidase